MSRADGWQFAEDPAERVVRLVDTAGGNGRHQAVRTMLERALDALDDGYECKQAVLILRRDAGRNRAQTEYWQAGCDLVQVLGVLECGRAQILEDSYSDE